MTIDKKISQLTPGTPDNSDYIPYVDISTGETKRALKSELDGVDAPEVQIQYSSDNVSFHNTFVSGDFYIRFSTDGGSTWSTGKKFIGNDGLDGLDGSDGTSITDVTANKVGAVTTITISGTFPGSPETFEIQDGDMSKTIYDPAGIEEQLVGETATQTLTNKTIDANNNTITNIGTDELSDNSVTFAKMQNINTNKLIGRYTSGNGDPEEVGIGNNLEISGSNLQAKTGTTSGTVLEGSKDAEYAKLASANVFTETQTIDKSTSDTIPSLGALGGRFRMINQSNYGLLGGVLGTGNVFLQSQRVDGTATAYNLLLQPNGGNAGIGTTSPGAKLHNKGTTFVENSSWTNNIARPSVGAGTIDGEIRGIGSSGSAGDHGLLRLSAGGGTGSRKSFIDISGYSSNADAVDCIVFGTQNTENMRIKQGNVGIGTTGPVSPGHIYQNNTEVGAGAGLTIEQDGTGDATLQLLRTGVVRWKVGSPSNNTLAFSYGALTSPVLQLKNSTINSVRISSVANTSNATTELDSMGLNSMIIATVSGGIYFYTKDGAGVKRATSINTSGVVSVSTI